MGRYHLAEPLGGGPTGEVFRAKVYGVAGFEREFAVKRFHSGFVSDPEIAATIAAATRTYGSLEHPRIARLHEYGVAGGETFTATELTHGIDVARLIGMTQGSGQALPPGAAVFLISQAARAVGYAHGRGISHLGLCPTNVIATADGDLKITDFCLLPTRLPDRPGEDLSLHARMPYLAPEQLVGEPTSPATDVYQLGVIACELLTGAPPFTGAHAPDIARKILSAEPPALKLEAPLADVLQRCLSRSPFERYPDARALADALDAAVREAALPGGQRELSAGVRDLMARLGDMNDSNNSGAVSFPLPAPPSPHMTYTSSRPSRATTTAPPARVGVETVPMPTLDAAASSGSMPALAATPRASTAAGKAGRARGPSHAGMPPLTLRDKLRGDSQGEGPEDDSVAREIGYLEDDAPTTVRAREIGFVSVSDTGEQDTVAPPPALAAAAAPPGPAHAGPVPAGPSTSPPVPNPAATMPLHVQRPSQRPVVPIPPDARPAPAQAGPPASRPGLAEAPAEQPGPAKRPSQPGAASPGGLRPAPSHTEQDFTVLETLAPGGTPSGLGPEDEEDAPQGTPSRPDGMPLPSPPESGFLPVVDSSQAGIDALLLSGDAPASPAPSTRKPWKWLAAIALLCGLGGGGYMLYDRFLSGASPGSRSADPPDRASGQEPEQEPPGPDEAPRAVAAATGDAGAPDTPPGHPPAEAAADAGDQDDETAGQTTSQTAGASDKLVIRSQPRRARVYLDGSPQGKTPLTLDATADSHRLALILPGHQLHTADIDGNGTIEVALEEVTPPGGPAGIKVRCRKKNRYYVIMNGHDTGQLCPTERIGVDLGENTLEIYDPINDSRQEFRVNVEDTHHSVRVRVD